MTARDALAQAVAAPSGERLHLFETVCESRGACQRERLNQRSGPLDVVSGLFDALRCFGSPVNPMPEFTKVH
jgi:hypothetical protein